MSLFVQMYSTVGMREPICRLRRLLKIWATSFLPCVHINNVPDDASTTYRVAHQQRTGCQIFLSLELSKKCNAKYASTPMTAIINPTVFSLAGKVEKNHDFFFFQSDFFIYLIFFKSGI